MADTPWAEVEVIRLRPSRLRRRCSRGSVMPCSTSSAAAPDQSTRTLTTSRAKVGKNWMFIRFSASTPASTMTTMTKLPATR